MSESIGIHIYSIEQYQNRKPNPINYSMTGQGAMLRDFCEGFFRANAETTSTEERMARSWFFCPQNINESTYHGVVRYGSSGFESDIVDRESQELNYKRKTSDIEMIDLYYRLWVPEYGSTALLALQSFGHRSCVGIIQRAMQRAFSEKNKGYNLKYGIIMPSQLSSYSNGEVKALNLHKGGYSSDLADNVGSVPGQLIDLDLRVSAQPRHKLGYLKDIIHRIQSIGENQVLNQNGVSYERASAEVKIGDKVRKVSLIGIDKNTGKIDLTSDVEIGVGGHPVFDSISSEIEAIFSDVASGSTQDA